MPGAMSARRTPVEGGVISDAPIPPTAGAGVARLGDEDRLLHVAQARRTLVLVADSPSEAARGDDDGTDETTDPPAASAVTDQQDLVRADTVPPGTP
jgi:hypothetical protein